MLRPYRGSGGHGVPPLASAITTTLTAASPTTQGGRVPLGGAPIRFSLGLSTRADSFAVFSVGADDEEGFDSPADGGVKPPKSTLQHSGAQRLN